MPNAFAYFALVAWPVVAFFLFRALPRAAALIWTIVGGYLLLPIAVGFDLPMVPTVDKTLIPALCAAVLCLMSRDLPAVRRAAPLAPANEASFTPPAPRSRGTRRVEVAGTAKAKAPIGWLEWMLLAALVVGPLVTAMQNSEPLVIGPRWLPGLTLYDGASGATVALISILPYLLARRFLADEKQQTLLLSILCVAALGYSLLALVEVRLSPQLSRWVYGFLYQSFLQTMRDSGFRPAVFLQSGLWLALFLAMGLLAGAALGRTEAQNRFKWVASTAWLVVTLALCRSLGALAIALALLPVVALVPPRGQLMLAAAVAAIAISYPALRGAQLVPVDTVLSMSGSVSADRAQSFEFRLKNEDQLLAHANEKPLSGWGGWGRSRIYDPDSGRDISVTDGTWIITIGNFGWLGYVGQFGLLTLPIFVLALRRRSQQTSLATAGLCLILAGNLIDLIPNATLTPVTWLVAGAIMGRASMREAAPVEPTLPGRQTSTFTRPEGYRPTRRKAPATLR